MSRTRNRWLLVGSAIAALAGCSGETVGPDLAPVAHAGVDREVEVGQQVVLDGSGSYDPEGAGLFYSWQLVAAPSHARASLSGADTAAPSFTPDLPGVWVVRLIVS